jgi:hypothetical protein
MFSAVWFGRCKITQATLTLTLTSPEPVGEGLLSPSAFLSPQPSAGGASAGAGSARPAGTTPRRGASVAEDAAPLSASGSLPAVTPLPPAGRADDAAGAEAPPVVTLVADRSIAQIVELVQNEDSTGWLQSMLRRLLYGGDDVGDPRMGDKKVWSEKGCLPRPRPTPLAVGAPRSPRVCGLVPSLCGTCLRVSGGGPVGQTKRRKKRMQKMGDGDDDADDDEEDREKESLADDAAAPALRDRFDAVVFGRCCELVDALVNLLMTTDRSTQPPDAKKRGMVRGLGACVPCPLPPAPLPPLSLSAPAPPPREA